MPHFDRSPFQIGAQRASTSSSSSFSSSSSYGFDRRSKVSQFTDQTPLATPVDSVDSIFGNNPELARFPDLLAWDGLTDEQWKLHSLLYKAERAIEGAAKDILDDFEDFLKDEILYDDMYVPDDEFDAVAVVRARLAKGEQTTMTRRALDIMDSRSGVAPTSIDYTNLGGVEYPIAEEIDDYAETFKVGGDEVLDIPATHNGSIHSRCSFLEAIEEVDEGREPDSLFNVTFPSPFLFESDIVVPPSPPIRPVDAVGNRLSFPISDTTSSTPKLISQLMVSPLLLNNPDITSSPAIFRNSFRNIDPRSPIVAISSVLFSSRLPLPTSLLDESLDEVAARFRISDIDDVNIRASVEFSQEGLGLVGVPIGKGHEFQTSHLDKPSATKVKTPGAIGSVSESSSEFDLPSSRDPGPWCSEAVRLSPFEPARSPWDILLESLRQGVIPYVPTLDYTIAYTGPGTNIGFDGGITVAAGSDHPVASASFITSINEASETGKGAKGLGLGLPMGVEQRVSRCCTSGLPSSEGCLDLASLAARLMETDGDSLGDFRGHVLSPIAEEPAAQRDDPRPTFSEPPVPSPPSPKKRRSLFKRILRFVLPTFSIRRRH